MLPPPDSAERKALERDSTSRKALVRPGLDPQVGDCLCKQGADYNYLLRFVTMRDGLKVTFVTTPKSQPRVIWLNIWQDWATGADVLQVGGTDDALEFGALHAHQCRK